MKNDGSLRHHIITRLANNKEALTLFLIIAASFVYYLWLIINNPALYWYDPYDRIAFRNQILLGQWLPLVQIIIFLFYKFSSSLLLLRALLALFACLSVLSFNHLANRVNGKFTGLIAALLLATNTMFTAMAIVPYLEVIFVGLVFATLGFLDFSGSRKAQGIGIICLNLACLTRYEGWLLAGIFFIEWILAIFMHPTKRANSLLGLTFLIAPISWLAIGVSESGGWAGKIINIFSFETSTASENILHQVFARFDLSYLREFSQGYVKLIEWQLGWALIIFSFIGVLSVIINPIPQALHRRILIFVILDILLLTFLQPLEFTNMRTAFVFEMFLILYAAIGLVESLKILVAWMTRILTLDYRLESGLHFGITILLSLAIAWESISFAPGFIQRASRVPDFWIPFQFGNWLNDHSKFSESVLILSDDTFQVMALSVFTNRPYEDILDDRMEASLLIAKANSSKVIYITEMYSSRDGLSAEEHGILHALENGRIKSEVYTVEGRRIWKVEGSTIVSFLYDGSN